MSFHMVSKAFRVVRTRPLEFLSQVRGYLLFSITQLLRPLFFNKTNYHFGQNLRLQKLKCVSAELPHAQITIGEHSVIYENAQIRAYQDAKINIGARNVIGDVRIYARKNIKIGQRCVFSWNVFMQDFHPHPIAPEQRAQQLIAMTESFQPRFSAKAPDQNLLNFKWSFPCEEIIVGDDVWFGANTTILPGVSIGNGSIVATGAVVTRGTYGANSILAGNPAKVVKVIS